MKVKCLIISCAHFIHAVGECVTDLTNSIVIFTRIIITLLRARKNMRFNLIFRLF